MKLIGIEKGAFAVVTTDKRGVFAGVVVDVDGDTVALAEVRMCVRWSSDVRGVVGLAATGPTPGCRVTKAAPLSSIPLVTGVFVASDEARNAWEAEPWG